jgi:hypothetical protein
MGANLDEGLFTIVKISEDSDSFWEMSRWVNGELKAKPFHRVLVLVKCGQRDRYVFTLCRLFTKADEGQFRGKERSMYVANANSKTLFSAKEFLEKSWQRKRKYEA